MLEFRLSAWPNCDRQLKQKKISSRSLSSILAVLAADPDTGIITYGDTSVRHANKNKVVLEFVDFYQTHHTHTLNYLIFDSKFTTKEQLKRLDELPNPINLHYSWEDCRKT